jgi:hypothetical protein
MSIKLDSFLADFSASMENDPKSDVVYDLSSFLSLNESTHLLNKALSQYLNPEATYRAYSTYSFSLNEYELTIQSFIGCDETLKSNEIFYLDSESQFYYAIKSLKSQQKSKITLPVEIDDGRCFVELELTSATYTVTKIKSYTRDQTNVKMLDFSDQGDFKSLDWKFQKSLGKLLNVSLDKKHDFWTDDGKRQLFSAWTNSFKEKIKKIA